MACRNIEGAIRTSIEIKEKYPRADLIVKQIDLSSLKAILNFVEELEEDTIDILINNAGLLTYKRESSHEGFEMQFVTNYLGNFYLTMLLLPRILRGKSPRIINVTSIGYLCKYTLEIEE